MGPWIPSAQVGPAAAAGFTKPNHNAPTKEGMFSSAAGVRICACRHRPCTPCGAPKRSVVDSDSQICSRLPFRAPAPVVGRAHDAIRMHVYMMVRGHAYVYDVRSRFDGLGAARAGCEGARSSIGSTTRVNLIAIVPNRRTQLRLSWCTYHEVHSSVTHLS